MRIVIPSKGRAQTLQEKALRLFPDAIICVGDDETKTYSKVSDNLLVHPASVVGIGPLRQWVLDNVADPCVVMVDDDVTHVYSQVGFHKRRIECPDEARAIVERLAIVAQDAKARVFGFQQAARPLGYANFKPFSVNTWVGGADRDHWARDTVRHQPVAPRRHRLLPAIASQGQVCDDGRTILVHPHAIRGPGRKCLESFSRTTRQGDRVSEAQMGAVP